MRKKEEVAQDFRFRDLKAIVKAAFGQRRKTLRNALKAFEFHDFPELETWKTKRAEQLSVEDFKTLARNLVNG